ncbi:MAG: HAMP domain-containing histidine kinase, partial [Candidatus Omnitrophica bacterium]|nr:HAMP domain-containing histidine kinase [Candidatus Omnitrophota bacterium]
DLNEVIKNIDNPASPREYHINVQFKNLMGEIETFAEDIAGIYAERSGYFIPRIISAWRHIAFNINSILVLEVSLRKSSSDVFEGFSQTMHDLKNSEVIIVAFINRMNKKFAEYLDKSSPQYSAKLDQLISTMSKVMLEVVSSDKEMALERKSKVSEGIDERSLYEFDVYRVQRAEESIGANINVLSKALESGKEFITTEEFNALPDGLRSYLDIIIKEGPKALALMDKTMSKTEEYSMWLCDVDTLIENIVESFRARYPEVEFRVNISGALKRSVLAYAGIIEKTLDELISNSIKYSKTKRVDVDASYFHGRIQLQVRDHGLGIDKAKILSKAKQRGLVSETAILSGREINNLIFASGLTEAEDDKGTGIGLASIKGSIEAVAGTIQVRSKEGKGTIFNVEMPLLKKPGRIKKLIVKLLFPKPFIIVVSGLMGSYRKVIYLALASTLGLRPINGGWIVRVVMSLMLKDIEAGANIDTENPKEVALYIKETIFPRISYQEPVVVDGVDSMVVLAGSVRSLRDEVKLMFRGAGERIKLFYQISGYKEVKDVINEFLEEVIVSTVASGEFAGAILRVTEPCFYDKALQIMLISSDKKRAKESNCSLDEIKRRDKQTNMDSFNPKRYPVKIREIKTAGITHYKGYRKALRAVIIYSISYILRMIFRWNIEPKQRIAEKGSKKGKREEYLAERMMIAHHLITLRNHVAEKKVVKLPLIRASVLNKDLQVKAAESLERWLVFAGEYQPEHVRDIGNYMRYLKGEAEEPGELYLALSVDGDYVEVEGWIDLKVTLKNIDGAVVNEYAVMEIAPWNRNSDRDSRRYVNLAPELRAFGLRKVLAENTELESKIFRSKVTTLGERDVKQHVFADGMEPWFVEEYIERCERNTAELVAQYREKDDMQGSDGFVFKQWQKEQKVLVEGPYGKTAAVGRPSGEKTAEINAKLNSVRRKILEQGFFREDEIDNLEVRVLQNAYKSATFRISGPAQARKTTLDIDHRTFNNEDFLFIVIKHELTDLRLKAIIPDLNPALMELFTIITVNIAEFMVLRDQHADRAKALVDEYAQLASLNHGLYKRYVAILNDPSIKDQLVLISDIYQMISSESVYFPNVRDHMKEFNAGDSEFAMTMLRIHIRTVERAFNDSKETTGPEELKPLASLQGTRSIPRALEPFMPYAQSIEYKIVDGLYFLKIKFEDKDKKEKYAHVLLDPKDNIESILGKGGHLFGLTYEQWRMQVDQQYSSGRFEDENSDGVFSFPHEGIVRERKAFYNMIIREPLTRLINRINQFNLGHSSRDISEELKNKFKDLIKLMGEKATVSKFTLSGLIRMNAKSHKLYWHIWNRYVLDYVNKIYP